MGVCSTYCSVARCAPKHRFAPYPGAGNTATGPCNTRLLDCLALLVGHPGTTEHIGQLPYGDGESLAYHCCYDELQFSGKRATQRDLFQCPCVKDPHEG